MNKITLFESFSGIGSQYKALQSLMNLKSFKKLDTNFGSENGIEVIGLAEWDMNSIIAYHRIHRKSHYLKDIETIIYDKFNISLSLNKKHFQDTERKEELSKLHSIQELILKEIKNYYSQGFVFSNDTKKPLALNSFKRIDLAKLIQFYCAFIYYNNASSVSVLSKNDDYFYKLKPIDIFTYSFPCQAISLQGKQEGLKEDSGTSSSLLWEIKHFLEKLSNFSQNKQLVNVYSEPFSLPKYLLMENVAALFNQKNSEEWNRFKLFLQEIGYETKEVVLKASCFNIPQNRDRAFALSILKDNPNKDKIFTLFEDLQNTPISNVVIDNFLDKSLSEKMINELSIDKKYFSQLEKFKLSNITKNHICKIQLEDYTTFSSENAVYHSKNGVAPTITAQGAQSRVKIYDEDHQVIRYMTDKEHMMLMGFEEDDYNYLVKYNQIPYFSSLSLKNYEIKSNMVKKMTGNSIVVNVLKAIFNIIIENDYFNK